MPLLGHRSTATRRLAAECRHVTARTSGSADVPKRLRDLLVSSTRCSAFGGALIVRGTDDIAAWNSSTGWRVHYGAPSGLTFFASDVLGGQFGVLPNGRVAFMEPEAGRIEEYARSVETWSSAMLDSHGAEAGLPLVEAWEASHGHLPVFHRLVPPVLFSLGGDAEPRDMAALPELEAMRVYSGYAAQLRHLRPGERFAFGVAPGGEHATDPATSTVKLVGDVSEGDRVSLDGESWSPVVDEVEWTSDTPGDPSDTWTSDEGDVISFVDLTFEDGTTTTFPARTRLRAYFDGG